MSNRTKRTLRTCIQVLVAVATAIPTVVAQVPLGAVGIQVVAVATIFTHYFYLAEKVPGFPAWLILSDAQH